MKSKLIKSLLNTQDSSMIWVQRKDLKFTVSVLVRSYAAFGSADVIKTVKQPQLINS